MASPNGKKGSQKHQEVQKAEQEKTKLEFLTEEVKVDTEVPISTPNGKKKGRVADVAAFSMEKPLEFFKIVQIGRMGKDGKPVKREQEAIEDIEAHFNVKVNFVDYENYFKHKKWENKLIYTYGKLILKKYKSTYKAIGFFFLRIKLGLSQICLQSPH